MSSHVRSYTRGTSPFQGDMVGVVVVVGTVTLMWIRRRRKIRRISAQCSYKTRFSQCIVSDLVNNYVSLSNAVLYLYLLHDPFCPQVHLKVKFEFLNCPFSLKIHFSSVFYEKNQIDQAAKSKVFTQIQ